MSEDYKFFLFGFIYAVAVTTWIVIDTGNINVPATSEDFSAKMLNFCGDAGVLGPSCAKELSQCRKYYFKKEGNGANQTP